MKVLSNKKTDGFGAQYTATYYNVHLGVLLGGDLMIGGSAMMVNASTGDTVVGGDMSIMGASSVRGVAQLDGGIYSAGFDVLISITAALKLAATTGAFPIGDIGEIGPAEVRRLVSRSALRPRAVEEFFSSFARQVK